MSRFIIIIIIIIIIIYLFIYLFIFLLIYLYICFFSQIDVSSFLLVFLALFHLGLFLFLDHLHHLHGVHLRLELELARDVNEITRVDITHETSLKVQDAHQPSDVSLQDRLPPDLKDCEGNLIDERDTVYHEAVPDAQGYVKREIRAHKYCLEPGRRKRFNRNTFSFLRNKHIYIYIF